MKIIQGGRADFLSNPKQLLIGEKIQCPNCLCMLEIELSDIKNISAKIVKSNPLTPVPKREFCFSAPCFYCGVEIKFIRSKEYLQNKEELNKKKWTARP